MNDKQVRQSRGSALLALFFLSAALLTAFTSRTVAGAAAAIFDKVYNHKYKSGNYYY